MKVTSIQVGAARTFNHPHEQYSNLRPEVVMNATLDENEDPVAATKALQAQAEQLVEDHKQGLLRSLEEIYQMSERLQEVSGLQRKLTEAQQRLDEIRREHPQLQLAEPAKPEPSNADVVF